MLNFEKFDKLSPKTTKSGKSRSDIARASIRKGKNGERFCADFLTEISGMTFMRIPNSGARLGQSNRSRIFQYSEDQIASMLGDLYCPPRLQKFWIIESKNYASLPFKKLQKGQKPVKITKWIDEIIWDTITYVYYTQKSKKTLRNVLPFLIIKITHENAWVVYNKQYLLNEYPLLQILPEYIFEHSVDDVLKNLNFGSEWVMENFKHFFTSNKSQLFLVT